MGVSINSTKNCPQCGAPLQENALAGLCPRCVMALNFQTQTVLTGDPGTIHAPPPTPAELAPNFPQLEILECLGRGGMGVVYKARQPQLDRVVALKILAPERVTDTRFAERFLREARALAKLNHPNIVTIHDFGQAGGYFYLLMEFVDGVNLRDVLRKERMAPREALAIVPAICEALQYAHDRGVIHRDIKPENILLDKEGRVKIADFGIARMMRSPAGEDAAILGTPKYMAPEQAEKPGEADHRADIYSLGVVLYEMLTGELPGKSLEPPSRKVHIDVRLDEIVLRALEKKPELRYQQASVFKTQVETIANGPETRTPEIRLLRPTIAAALCAVIGLVSVFLAIVIDERIDADTPEIADLLADGPAVNPGNWAKVRTWSNLIHVNRYSLKPLAVVGISGAIIFAAITFLRMRRLKTRGSPFGLTVGAVNIGICLAVAAAAIFWTSGAAGKFQRGGQWQPQSMNASHANVQNPLAAIRITDIEQASNIVVFTLVSEAGYPMHVITPEFKGLPITNLLLMDSPVPDLNCLLAPGNTVMGWGDGTSFIGDSLNGALHRISGKLNNVTQIGNSQHGPGEFRYGFYFPDVQLAAMAARQGRHAFLGNTNFVGESTHSLVLFDLKHSVREPDTWENGWHQLTATLNVVRDFDVTFGPVLEWELPKNEKGPTDCLDLETDTLWPAPSLPRILPPGTPRPLGVLPSGISVGPRNEYPLDSTNSVVNAIGGTALRYLTSDEWEKMSAAQAMTIAETIRDDPEPWTTFSTHFPATFLFKTKRHTVGLVQILGTNQAGVQVRFKRVHAKASATAKTIKSSDFRVKEYEQLKRAFYETELRKAKEHLTELRATYVEQSPIVQSELQKINLLEAQLAVKAHVQ